jgi:hypothetical protein
VSLPLSVAARSKVWVCGRSFPGIVVSNSAGTWCLFLVNVARSQAEVAASDCSLVQRSPTACDVSECDHEASIMRRLWSTGAVVKNEKKLCLM